MKKKLLKVLVFVMSFIMLLGTFVGCGGNNNGGGSGSGSGSGDQGGSSDGGTGGVDTSGGVSADGKTQINFAYFAGEDEAKVLAEAIALYNSTEGVQDNIFVTANPKPSNSYTQFIETLVGTNKGPDVFLVADRYIKRWSSTSFKLLENLDGYIDADTDMQDKLDKMWASAVWRNQYNPTKNTSNEDDPMYALPRDISPTSLYYNQDAFEGEGIICISVDEADIDAFNAGTKADRNGKYKSDYAALYPGLEDVEVMKKGFQRDIPYDDYWTEPAYGNNGKVSEFMIFNNRIAMSWDEVEDLGRIFTRKWNSNLTGTDTTWGYYTEWWFSYGWGVGGDCLEDTTGNGDWAFVLGDNTKKKLVYNADGSYATDARGKAIFVKESQWSSYQLGSGQYLGDVLPTQFEAFERFYDLGRPIANGGLEIAMRQKADIGTSTAHKFFIDGKVAMLVQPSTVITAFNTDCTFKWDVAPLPIYKEYVDPYDDEVANQGIQIGHSAQTSVGVWSKSANKDAAYKFAKFLSSGAAQTKQAQAGYFLSNYNTESEKNAYINGWAQKGGPKNISILTDIVTLQQPADWWYMPYNDWIDAWATDLNTKYRESDYTAQQFFDTYTNYSNYVLNDFKDDGVLNQSVKPVVSKPE